MLGVALGAAHRLAGVGLLVSISGLVSCASGGDAGAFRVPREQVYERIQRVAVLPLEVTEASYAPAAAAVVDEIGAELRRAGFAVVPADSFKALWDREVRQAGGLFDPATGHPDRARIEAVWKRSLAALAEAEPFDAVLVPSLTVVRAPFWANYAHWDGATDAVRGVEKWDTFARDYRGDVSALSLQLVLQDVDGAELYAAQGGVQVLARLHDGKFQDLPASDVLADPERNRAAVAIALGPLTGRE